MQKFFDVTINYEITTTWCKKKFKSFFFEVKYKARDDKNNDYDTK